ncbi:MAG: hypothetical protein J7598_24490 [Mitsuaria chitosanitabida]|uniref:hypothetical protein n=1 Tax=Roseateles chitosanitabidus TaxID=65048 RepID=UPI001B059D2E|nr:hypothetical protein [Roseateles chitosanitabidus]MBO9689772.1 hypothetical protein [Roseateles chitosanitabidus]
MPSTFNGTGTKYYGQREHDRGGMYITTKWIVLLGLPLVPLSSWRVFPHGEGVAQDHSHLLSSGATLAEQTYEAQRVPMNWRQVLNVYAIVIPIVTLLIWAFIRVFPGFSVKF